MLPRGISLSASGIKGVAAYLNVVRDIRRLLLCRLLLVTHDLPYIRVGGRHALMTYSKTG